MARKRAAGVAASLPSAVQYTYNFERSSVAVAGPVSGGSVTQDIGPPLLELAGVLEQLGEEMVAQAMRKPQSSRGSGCESHRECKREGVKRFLVALPQAV